MKGLHGHTDGMILHMTEKNLKANFIQIHFAGLVMIHDGILCYQIKRAADMAALFI